MVKENLITETNELVPPPGTPAAGPTWRLQAQHPRVLLSPVGHAPSLSKAVTKNNCFSTCKTLPASEGLLFPVGRDLGASAAECNPLNEDLYLVCSNPFHSRTLRSSQHSPGPQNIEERVQRAPPKSLLIS